MPPSNQHSRDEAAYAAVLAELRGGVRDEPLMAKAYAEAEGEDNKARALYLRWRAARLMEIQDQERLRAFSAAGPTAQWSRPARKARRSWSQPRPYDFLLVIAVLVGLYLFSGDFHHMALRLLRGLGFHPG